MELKISCRPYRFKLRRPVYGAKGEINSRTGIHIFCFEIGQESDAGAGDAAPLPGYSVEDISRSQREIELFGRGGFPRDLKEAAHSAIFATDRPVEEAALESIGHFFASRDLAASSACGIEQATLAWISRQKGIELHELLGAEKISSIQLSILVRGPKEAAFAAAHGACCLKLKVGRTTLDEDYRNLAEVRRVVGREVSLRVDANESWSRGEAARAIALFEPLNLESIEQPLAAADIEGMAELRRASETKIAADESVRGEEEARVLLDSRAADCLVLKPQMMGGLLAARRVSARAHAEGVAIAFSSSFESLIGSAGIFAVAAAARGPKWPSGIFPPQLPEAQLPKRVADPRQIGDMATISSRDLSLDDLAKSSGEVSGDMDSFRE